MTNQNKDREEFEDLMFDVGTYCPEAIPESETNKIWSWIQSYTQKKQQEKIERVKNIDRDKYFKQGVQDWSFDEILSDVLKIMEEK